MTISIDKRFVTFFFLFHASYKRNYHYLHIHTIVHCHILILLNFICVDDFIIVNIIIYFS